MAKAHSIYLKRNFYAPCCSLAFLFQILWYIALIVPPYFVALSTECKFFCVLKVTALWVKHKTVYEQPQVKFQSKIIASISSSSFTSSPKTWTTFPQYNSMIGSKLTSPVVKVPIFYTYHIVKEFSC
jgi:hypothetical protein